jgi:hypothetical protein
MYLLYQSQTPEVKSSFQNLFYLNNEGWNISGYKNMSATFMPYNFNGLMTNFIVGHDDVINVDHKNKDDRNLWFFSKQLTETVSLVNTSIMSFTMSSFVGNFTNLNNPNSSTMELVKLFNNVTQEHIVFPIRNLVKRYNGNIQEFVIPMVYQVWINGKNNMPMIYDDFKRILKNISHIYILGDWTRGNETVGLDNVKIE